VGLRILGTDIAGILNRALGTSRMSIAGTLQSVARTTRSSSALGAGQRPTYASHEFRGFADSTHRAAIPEDIQQKVSRIVLILGDSLTSGIVPKVNDRVVFEGATGTVLWVDRDPDAASYILAVRD
jgi:hypothetical protein